MEGKYQLHLFAPGMCWARAIGGQILIKPAYLITKLIPSKREAAKKLDTITINQMIKTLALSIRSQSVENRYMK